RPGHDHRRGCAKLCPGPVLQSPRPSARVRGMRQVAVVVADTGDPGRVNCASSNGWQADAASRFALRRVTISC
ncbi:MAG: hypothetical protein WBW82_10690, partial [Candidatus Sulfotelmatobacter sp.]